MSDAEIWKYIDEFHKYAVSTDGLVANIDTDRVLTPVLTRAGYCQVSLSSVDGIRTRYVHQLVAEAFLGDWRPGVRVAHLDNNLRNNSASNLVVMRRGMQQPTYDAIPRERARRIRIVETGEIFRTAQDCALAIEGHPTHIYSVLRGHRKSHRGLTFEYLESR